MQVRPIFIRVDTQVYPYFTISVPTPFSVNISSSSACGILTFYCLLMHNKTMEPICNQISECKCCGSSAHLYGVVDFNKHCSHNLMAPVGIPVYYYRCVTCDFIFTNAFDEFSKNDFNKYIYNGDYILVDSEFKEERPKRNAKSISELLSANKNIHILDYGGGQGGFAEILKESGFTNVDTYDPFYGSDSVKPEKRYDCITCLEVAEHSIEPRETFKDIFSLLKDDGIVMLATLIQPETINEIGVNWWYIAPRNGHVSIYSMKSLQSLIEPYHFSVNSFYSGFHVLFRLVPEFARHFFRSSP